MWPNPQIPADLLTFTEEILNGKLRVFFVVEEVMLPHWSLLSNTILLSLKPYQNVIETNVSSKS